MKLRFEHQAGLPQRRTGRHARVSQKEMNHTRLQRQRREARVASAQRAATQDTGTAWAVLEHPWVELIDWNDDLEQLAQGRPHPRGTR